MTKVRRLLAIATFLGVVAIVSSGLQGQQGKKAGTGTTPQASPASKVSQLAEAVDSRFTLPGVLTYQPIKGDISFALQLKPKLDPTPRRPRDFLILISTSATQAGHGWIAAHQIAEGIIETASDTDRVALWKVNSPENTKPLIKDGPFLSPKDRVEGKRLRDAIKQYRATEYPSGDTDLKTALEKTIATFEPDKERQRILLFLGDGLSTHNPITNTDRLAIARKMIAKQVAFFPVPLGIQLDPKTLHGLANGTGGTVLRTHVADEMLVDALKRYEQAFAGTILYDAAIQLPADFTEVCPSSGNRLISPLPATCIKAAARPRFPFRRPNRFRRPAWKTSS
jgi:hypothetical protein